MQIASVITLVVAASTKHTNAMDETVRPTRHKIIVVTVEP
jgi:hypothetical protein